MGYATEEIKKLAVKAYLKNPSIIEVSSNYHIDRSTLYRWVNQYKKNKNLARKCSPGSGRVPLLNKERMKKLLKIILKPASKFGFETDFWTTKRIRIIVKKKFNIEISKTSMYEALYYENYSYKKPEKRYYEGSDKMKLKWVNEVLPEIKKCIKEHRAILYFEDESNISLNAVLGKTWGPIGKTTIQKTTGNKASISAMSAITSSGKLIFTLHEKSICSTEIITFLSQMLKHHPRRHLVVIMDNAPPHTSGITQEYIKSEKRLHVFYLPPRTPEFNADEKVWNYLKNEEMKSHSAKSKVELKRITKNKLMKMSKKPRLLRALFKRSEISELLKIN